MAISMRVSPRSTPMLGFATTAPPVRLEKHTARPRPPGIEPLGAGPMTCFSRRRCTPCASTVHRAPCGRRWASDGEGGNRRTGGDQAERRGGTEAEQLQNGTCSVRLGKESSVAVEVDLVSGRILSPLGAFAELLRFP